MFSVILLNVMKGDIDDMYFVCVDYFERKVVKLGLEKFFFFIICIVDWLVVYLFCFFVFFYYKLGIFLCLGFLYDMLRLFVLGLYNGDL